MSLSNALSNAVSGIVAASRGTEVVVLEMAMRGVGQIAELTANAEPDVGVIVNVGPVHLELVGTIQRVAEAKAELIAELRSGAACVVPALEEALDREGLTFGHLPQSWEFATVGGYAATRSSGQASTGVGRFDDLVTGLTLATPAGVLELGHPQFLSRRFNDHWYGLIDRIEWPYQVQDLAIESYEGSHARQRPLV